MASNAGRFPDVVERLVIMSDEVIREKERARRAGPAKLPLAAADLSRRMECSRRR